MAKHSGAQLDLSAFTSPEVFHDLSLLLFLSPPPFHSSLPPSLSLFLLPLIFSYVFLTQELMSLGLDRLKSALMALGLKCGGLVVIT